MSRTHLSYTIEGLAERLRDQDRRIADLERERGEVPDTDARDGPAWFHWPGSVADLVDERIGPWIFPNPGQLYIVRYIFDTAPASDATVEWYFDGSATATWTHTLPAGDKTPQEPVAVSYHDEPIISVVTDIDTTAAGLTAYVFKR